MTISSVSLRLTGARLIDGTGAGPVPDAELHVDEDGRILFAGPAAHAPVVAATVTRDLGGRTLLPGFIDAHVHLGFDAGNGPFHDLTTDPVQVVFETGRRLEQTLHAGVTTARDLAGLTLGHKAAVEQGLVAGPRLHTAVRIMSHTGGHSDFHLPGGHVKYHVSAADEIADTVDEVRTATRRLLRDGADVIKVCTTGGMSSPHDQPTDEGITADEIRAIRDEVDRHGGRPIAAHAQGTAGILAALRGGVDSVEHAYGIDDEGIDLAGENGTFLVPTLSTVFTPLVKERMRPFHYEKKVRWVEITRVNIARAIERGARFAMGTDSGICAHGRNLAELSHLVELGMSPMDALRAGTAHAAELLRVGDRLGTLEAGKIADFVVADVDPLADMSALGSPENVVVVAKAGRIVKDLLVSERVPVGA
ncbi:amidohydrolase [Microbacterium sp. CSI-V]|uniref:metal-dependent hydrolase family protein n=1 Tax=unclassified Microbacterium TaxID=2609290 RepID=UPI00097C09D3|nr:MULTISPECIES: amidohydrolase family protein [unclassified Microbacterium]MXS75944.1 amidohydrolase family protein [Microbacterium sp. TL13]ONI65043.1 amidohydrolase [Microbacterium sp. CSI-V]